jgi:hypothetical protein
MARARLMAVSRFMTTSTVRLRAWWRRSATVAGGVAISGSAECMVPKR